MKYLISFLLCYFLPAICLAQDPISEDFLLDERIEYKLILKDLNIRKEILDGKEYGCFGKKETRSLLQLRMDFPKLQNTVKGLRKLINIKDGKIDILGQMNSNLKEQKDFLTQEIVGLRTKLDERDAWYKDPLLWWCIGVVVGTGTTVLVVYLVN